MIGKNPLRTKVLITTDEVVFHAPTDHAIDVRYILQSIIIAERRFIKPLLGASLYQQLIDAKNVLVTAANKATLQNDVNQGRGSDRELIVLQEGDYVNSDDYLTADQRELWQDHLHKLTAECVWYVALPVNRSRFTATGVVNNHPESVIERRDATTIALSDLKHLLDKGLFERIHPLIADMHAYICRKGFSGYVQDCGCDANGNPYRRRGGVLFGLYDEINKNCNCN